MRYAALLIVLVACSLPGRDGGSVDTPLPDLPVVDAETHENGHFPIDVVDGVMQVWPDRITRLPRGPGQILLRNGAQHPEEENVRSAIALWIRGRGSRVAFLPEFASKPLFPQTMEDWPVDLEPGTYEISVSLGGDANKTAIILVE